MVAHSWQTNRQHALKRACIGPTVRQPISSPILNTHVRPDRVSHGSLPMSHSNFTFHDVTRTKIVEPFSFISPVCRLPTPPPLPALLFLERPGLLLPRPPHTPLHATKTHTHTRVLPPTKVGERDYRIFVENLNNVADTLAVDILTSVVPENHRKGLRIETDKEGLLEGGSVLQFDLCYTGMPVWRKLRVKNTTVHAMDVSLGSDRPGEVRGRMCEAAGFLWSFGARLNAAEHACLPACLRACLLARMPGGGAHVFLYRRLSSFSSLRFSLLRSCDIFCILACLSSCLSFLSRSNLPKVMFELQMDKASTLRAHHRRLSVGCSEDESAAARDANGDARRRKLLGGGNGDREGGNDDRLRASSHTGNSDRNPRVGGASGAEVDPDGNGMPRKGSIGGADADSLSEGGGGKLYDSNESGRSSDRASGGRSRLSAASGGGAARDWRRDDGAAAASERRRPRDGGGSGSGSGSGDGGWERKLGRGHRRRARSGRASANGGGGDDDDDEEHDDEEDADRIGGGADGGLEPTSSSADGGASSAARGARASSGRGLGGSGGVGVSGGGGRGTGCGGGQVRGGGHAEGHHRGYRKAHSYDDDDDDHDDDDEDLDIFKDKRTARHQRRHGHNFHGGNGGGRGSGGGGGGGRGGTGGCLCAFHGGVYSSTRAGGQTGGSSAWDWARNCSIGTGSGGGSEGGGCRVCEEKAKRTSMKGFIGQKYAGRGVAGAIIGSKAPASTDCVCPYHVTPLASLFSAFGF